MIKSGDFVTIREGEFKNEIAKVTRTIGTQRVAVTFYGKTVILKIDDVELAG